MKSLSVTIQMKAVVQYFPVVLFITLYQENIKGMFSWLYKVALTFESLSKS